MEFSVNLKNFPKCFELTRKFLFVLFVRKKNLNLLFKSKNFALNINDLLDSLAFGNVVAVVVD